MDASRRILFEELSTYQFPQVSSEELLLEPHRAYTEMYIQQSQGYHFFRGYINPTILERAKIYRALDFSHTLSHTLGQGKSSSESCSEGYPYILFVSSKAVVIKKRPDYEFPQYDFFLSQSDQYVFVPPGADRTDQYDFVYLRRLLSNFNSTERISGKILFNQEQDRYFLMLALDRPLRDELTRKWTEYIQGGVIRCFDFRPDRLDQTLTYFGWSERDHFEILSNGLIRIWVRSSSLDDFQQKVTSIQSGLLSPSYSGDDHNLSPGFID